jgi:tRNA threonylcarbamoyladenosine modification (KEOPS) complex Cgi121 subunit
MLRYIEEYGRYVELSGFVGADFGRAEAFLKKNRSQTPNGVDVQFFDASLIATAKHLYFAVIDALASFKGATNVSKSVAVETALYAAAQRQIQKSIAKVGIKPQTAEIAVVIVGKDQASVAQMLAEVSQAVGCPPDDSVLELTEAKIAKICAVFNITQTELQAATRNTPQEALVALVVERAALLATQL